MKVSDILDDSERFDLKILIATISIHNIGMPNEILCNNPT